MKKLAWLILFVLVLQSVALSASDYEKKLEYRRKKLTVMVRSAYVGESSGYTSSDTDVFNITNTSEGFSYGNASTTGSSTRRTVYRQVSDWVIIKGGIRELTDLEFLEIVGDNDRADEIQRTMDDKGRYLVWGIGCGILGIGSVIAAGAATPADPALMTVGSVLLLGGIVLSYISSSPYHYLTADYVQEKSDDYNIKLKKSLSLPIETE